MRTLSAIFCLMLVWPSVAEEGPKKEEPSPKHLSEVRQLHFKPTMLFGNYGTTMGPSIALEVPIMQYFSLGGLFNAIFHFGGKTTILDFDALAKVMYPVRLGNYDASWYLLAPIGFSLGLTPHATKPGFNFALLPGFEFYLDRHWGIFTELGLNIHTFDNTFTQGQFSIGISYVF